jgi:serine/threonine protein kinase
MECVEGETLATRLDKGPLPLEQVLKFGMQIADALDKAHRSGVLHRDLKPGNIMLTSAGAKLLDFGLAKPAAALASAATLTGVQASPVTEEGTDDCWDVSIHVAGGVLRRRSEPALLEMSSYLRALIFLRLLCRLVLSTLFSSDPHWRWRFWRPEFRIARRKLFRYVGLFGTNNVKVALCVRVRCAGDLLHALSGFALCFVQQIP